jgi:hypothetical protein
MKLYFYVNGILLSFPSLSVLFLVDGMKLHSSYVFQRFHLRFIEEEKIELFSGEQKKKGLLNFRRDFRWKKINVER